MCNQFNRISSKFTRMSYVERMCCSPTVHNSWACYLQYEDIQSYKLITFTNAEVSSSALYWIKKEHSMELCCFNLEKNGRHPLCCE